MVEGVRKENILIMYKLRPYQAHTVALIIENIKKGILSQLIESPTGSG